MYTHNLFNGAKKTKIGKRGVFLVMVTNTGKKMAEKKEQNMQNGVFKVFMPRKYVL